MGLGMYGDTLYRLGQYPPYHVHARDHDTPSLMIKLAAIITVIAYNTGFVAFFHFVAVVAGLLTLHALRIYLIFKIIALSRKLARNGLVWNLFALFLLLVATWLPKTHLLLMDSPSEIVRDAALLLEYFARYISFIDIPVAGVIGGFLGWWPGSRWPVDRKDWRNVDITFAVMGCCAACMLPRMWGPLMTDEENKALQALLLRYMGGEEAANVPAV